MRLLIFAALILAPLPALAEQCNHWTAGMQEDEGGSVMTAGICAPSDSQVYLSATCGEPGNLSFRYLPPAKDGFPPSEGFKTKVQFDMDQETFTRPAVYEEMDGALAVDIEIGAPFVEAMQTHKAVTVSEASGKLPAVTLPLKGSRAAFRKLIATCSRK